MPGQINLYGARWGLMSSLLLLFVLPSCRYDVLEAEVQPDLTQYLFLGHIYQTASTIDVRIEGKDLSGFEQIWLGGDICAETTQDSSTLDYLDGIFDLGSERTHWALGNHDIRNDNIDWITEKTKRNTFYTSHFNGITLLVLNTNLWRCAEKEAQIELIQSICDSVYASSHLVVLNHHVVWGEIDQSIDPSTFANVERGGYPFLCTPNSTFIEVVFSQLEDVQARGVQVVFISGDLGQKATKFEYILPDGQVYIGSGITSETNYNMQFPTAGMVDEVLILNHDIPSRTLDWEFIDVNNL